MADEERWLDGGRFEVRIERGRAAVWDRLLAIERTPEWRTHLGSVRWADPGPPRVGSRIDVRTTLLWYRDVSMVCEVTRLDPEDGVFAYRVVDGPATTENTYRVTDAPGRATDFVMQGRVLLDGPLIRLTAPLLKLASDLQARREVARLKAQLESS